MAGFLVLENGRYVQWISFVHPTTEEFFERSAPEYFPAARFEIASACLKQLIVKEINARKLARHHELAMNEFAVHTVRYTILHANTEIEPRILASCGHYGRPAS